MRKHLLCPERIRQVPKQFSWVDHRLVRDHYLDRLTHQASSLYLFLVTVADVSGLSFYSDKSIVSRLHMERALFHRSRGELIQLGLIAYKSPLYQVLSLDEEPHEPAPGKSMDESHPLRQILRQISGNPHDRL